MIARLGDKRVKSTYTGGSSQRLPTEYQEVEYIESTGTQWIDSRLENKSTYSFRARFSVSDLTGASAVLGATLLDDPTYNSTFLAKHSSGPIRACCGSWIYLLDYPDVVANTIYDVEYTNENNVKTLFVNNEQISSITDSSSFAYGFNIYIFARLWSNGLIDSMAKIKLYELELHDGNNLVRNFVPCYRKTDSKIGLYDLVNGVFYTNAGTGTFLKGPNTNLPSEYQEVEYIESTGTQWFDSGVTVSSNIGVDLNFAQTENTATLTGGNSIIGARQGNVRFLFSLEYTPANRLYFIYGRNTTELYNPTQADTGNFNLKINCDGLGTKGYSLKYNNAIVANGTFTGDLTGNTKTIAVFAGHYNTDAYYKSAVKISSLKMYDNGAIIRDYIPCYRKSDDVIGMYDLVNGVFYTNAGTGTFLKGNDVSSIETQILSLYVKEV